MIRAFLDSSALFSAAYSLTGGARALLELALDEQISLVVSNEVVKETVRNLQQKAPQFSDALQRQLDNALLEYAKPSETIILKVVAYVEQKDTHVVAAAVAGRCTYIVSHDKIHLLKNEAIHQNLGIRVVTPGDLLAILRKID